MATVEDVTVRIGANITDFSRNLQKANAEIEKIGRTATELGRGLTTTFGAYSLAVGGALGYTVSKAADFDTAMRKAGAIAGATTEEFDLMKQAALDLGATTSLSASQVAVAMTELAASGFTANETIAAMPGIISAAEASGEDLALVSDTVASALNSFGLEASEAGRVADILAQASNSTAAGVRDMQYAFKYAAPVFNSLGLSMEELAGATGLLVNAGMAGEQAGTTLRAALLRLVDPPKEAARLMESLGFSALDAEGNLKGISDIAGDLGRSLQGMTEAQQAAALATIFGTEAVSGMLTLINAGPEVIDEMTESLENSEGASERAAEQMKAGIGGALEELNGAFETLAITIGDELTPYVQTLAEWLADLANRFNNLPKPVREFIVLAAATTAVLAGVIAVLGLIITFIGNTITALGNIRKVFSTFTTGLDKVKDKGKPTTKALNVLKGAIGGLGRAFRLITNPISLVIGLLTTFFVFLKNVYQEHEGFSTQVQEIWSGISEGISGFTTKIRNIVVPAFNEVKNALIPLKEASEGALGGMFGWITNIGDNIKQIFGDKVTANLNKVHRAFDRLQPIIDTVSNWSFDKINRSAQITSNILAGMIGAITKLLQGDFKGAWEAIKTTSENAQEDTVDLIGDMKGGFEGAIETSMDAAKIKMREKFTEWGREIRLWISNLPYLIEENLINVKNTLLGWIADRSADIAIQLTGWTSAISGWFDELPGKLATWVIEWGLPIKNFFTDMPTNIAFWLADWYIAITLFMRDVPGAISTQLEEWWNTFKRWFSSLGDKPEVKNAGANMIKQMTTGAEEQKETMVQRIGSLIVDIMGLVMVAIGLVIFSTGLELIDRFWNGVQSGKDWLLGKMKDLMLSLARKVTEIDWVQKGKDIVNGIIRGIEAIPLIGTAVRLGRKITSGLDKELEIKSPSKVMERKGRDVVIGYLQGIEGMSNAVDRTISRMSALMQPDIQPLSIGNLQTPSMAPIENEMLLNMARMEEELNQQQPARITLQLGAREYETFVEDITETQQRKEYTMKLFRG